MIVGQERHDGIEPQIDKKTVKLSTDNATQELIAIKETLHKSSDEKEQLRSMHRLVWICHQGTHCQRLSIPF